MFLGSNEMKYSKGRHVLAVLVMVLIAWLIFILSGLASGLAQGNRLAVDQRQTNQVVLSRGANSSLNVSVLNENVKETISGGRIAPIGQQSLTTRPADDKKAELTSVSLFGVEKKSFLMPKVTEGNAFTDRNQVIASEILKDQGFKISDKLTAGKYDEQLKIVGSISKSNYNIVSIIYTSLSIWRSIKYGDNPAMVKMANGLTVRSKDNAEVKTTNKDSQVLSISDFIEKLPGYSAQNLTLDDMIYFLTVIVAFIIGIFILMMTLQKTVMFGVLKAQGVPTNFLAKAVMLQTALLAVLGVATGLALTGTTVFFLSGAMPYVTNGPRMILFSALLILSALIGGAFSIRTIAEIDSLTVIGG